MQPWGGTAAIVLLFSNAPLILKAGGGGSDYTRLTAGVEELLLRGKSLGNVCSGKAEAWVVSTAEPRGTSGPVRITAPP